ncbi:tetratricopeptide repeat protein [Chloroflexota bacterium]|nr:tetratricopeptide repeat protein [Chloroflexota bacterium]
MKKPKALYILILILILTSCAQPVTQQGTPPVEDLTAATATAEPTPMPTPSPTATPLELTNDGDRAIIAGDYNRAIEIFQNALANTTDATVTDKSNLGIGQAYYEQDNYAPALTALRLAAASADTTIAAQANYFLAQSYIILERYDEAFQSFVAYLTLRPGVIDSTIHEQMGDLYLTVGNPLQAIASYQEAYRTDPSGGSESLAIKIAAAYQQSGDTATALALFQDIYNTTASDYTKAEMDLRIGQIYYSQENYDQAYAYFQDTVNNFPWAYDSYSALVTLVNDDVVVNEYQRGLINYNVSNYALAVEAFDRFLATADNEIAIGAALYYKGLAIRAYQSTSGEGQYDDAITAWQDLIENHPTSSYVIDAWEDIEYTQWAYMDEPRQAAETALAYVARYPESAEAADFLFLAGRSYERADALDLASTTWQQIGNEYPSADYAFLANYFAGIVTVRQGNWAAAQPLFSRALILTSEPSEIAAAYLWIGKCQNALGDVSAAVDTWKLAQTADPYGYYSIRAEDLLIGQEALTPPLTYDLDPDLSPYRMEAEDWVRTTFELPADTNLQSPGLLGNDPRFQRGLEYWALGLYPEAKAEFESIRLEVANDPAETFRLIPALVEIGLYRSALVASNSLLKLAGLEGATALDAPEFFTRVRFGAYYLDWVLPIAKNRNFDPLLLLAIMRQESHYEGFAQSAAYAYGVMQIIPTTGEELAGELGWPTDYTAADLYRPYVSILFGATYLARQLNYFDGDLYDMLAAYNGGPGNTLYWQELAGNDMDLFLETIRIQETRNYIRLITENYTIYRMIYGTMAER